MLSGWKKSILISAILFVYSVLFYFQFTLQLRMDFSSFYAAAAAYRQHINPFECFFSSFLPTPTQLPANLNPPFFLLLFSPLTYCNVETAIIIWTILSLLLGCAGVLIGLACTPPIYTFKQNKLSIILIYLSLYSTLMNTSIGQLGGFLIFFIMAGYYCLQHRHLYWTGFFWGIICTIKLFPALLLVYLYIQRQYLALFATCAIALFTTLLPIWTHGVIIYSQYIQMLPQVSWYGTNWNASLYGLLFRLIFNPETLGILIIIKMAYLLIFITVFLWYVKKVNYLTEKLQSHHAFCLTLVIMLLLSPLGWCYYFSLLIIPLALVGESINEHTIARSWWWSLAIILLNLPMGVVTLTDMHYFLYKITIYSAYCYGLILLAYLLSPVMPNNPSVNWTRATLPLKASLGLSFMVTVIILFLHR